MKYKGKKVVNDNLEIVVIPRKEADIVLKFKPVLNYERFEKLVEMPEAPLITYANNLKTRDTLDSNYLQKLTTYQALKTAFVFLESISASEDIEWETVDLNQPNTWENYTKELEDSGFTQNEMALMYEAIQRVNSLNDEHLEAAKNRFLASQDQV